MNNTNSAVILARVSSKSQEDEGYSLDSQIKLLQGYCMQRNLIVVKTFKIAETASKEQGRKVFHQLLDYIRKEGIYHLAVEKTDRLTRNFSDAVAIDEWLSQDEMRRLHAVKENILLHKEAKSDVKFMWNIHISVAKKYTDNLREEAMKGWAEKLAQGWLPASPPPGYRTVILNGKRIHEPDPKTSYIIKNAFSFYLQPGESIESTARELYKKGLQTRKGKPYHKSKVQNILRNKFYIGINQFNGKDYPGAQDVFISKSIFNKVQQKMTRKTNGRYRKLNPVFKSLIKCSDCGGLVTWQFQKGRFYGACQRKAQSCRGKKLLREDIIEDQLKNLMTKLVSPSKDIVDWVADTMQQDSVQELRSNELAIDNAKTQIERLNRMQANLYDDKLAGDIPLDIYETKRSSFKEQQKELYDRLVGLENANNRKLEYSLLLLELTQKAAEIYSKKKPEQKRIIITKLFKDLYFERDTLSVNYTNFAKAVADCALETNKIIGGKI